MPPPVTRAPDTIEPHPDEAPWPAALAEAEPYRITGVVPLAPDRDVLDPDLIGFPWPDGCHFAAYDHVTQSSVPRDIVPAHGSGNR